MKNLLMLLIASMALTACHRKPDSPPTGAAALLPNNPPVTTCTGGTVMYSSPAGETVGSNSSRMLIVPGFDLGCGSSMHVYIRKDNTQSWFELGTADLGASYYALSGNVVTVYNKTGITQEIDIEAILK